MVVARFRNRKLGRFEETRNFYVARPSKMICRAKYWRSRKCGISCNPPYDALKIFLISYHFPFHIFTLHFIFRLSHGCYCFNEEKIKLLN